MPNRRDHFINNQWVAGSGNLILSRNPATAETLWQGYAATDKEIHQALIAAREAFPEWAALTLDARIAYLRKFIDLLTQSLDEFAVIISKEVGKPLWESKNEVRSMIAKLDIAIQAYHERCPERANTAPSGNTVLRHKPHGVVGILGPFNFPGHLPNGHIIPALLAGNVVVFKASELTPLVAETMILLWEKAKLPPGVINLLQGGPETGRLLAGSIKLLDGLFFTGSWNTGQILSEQYAKYPDKILALEMGGNNPLIVSDIDDVKAAAYATIQSAYVTSGQRCTCARRLIVPVGPKGDAFLAALIGITKSIKIGPYTDQPEPFMGTVISEHAASHLIAVQDGLKSRGGEVLVEMTIKKVDSALLSPGLIDVTRVAQRLDEEFFGPLLQLVRVANFDEAIIEANQTAYGLTAALFSKSRDEYLQFYQHIKAGVINWNTPTTGSSSALPFGGIGRSGNHRPSGYYAADYCAYPVATSEAEVLSLPKELAPGIGKVK